MKNNFVKAVLVKSFLFLLIVLWGSYNSTLVNTKGSTEYFTDVGNILFLVFSIIYMFNSFFLIKLKLPLKHNRIVEIQIQIINGFT